jgi:hypothetical protein
MIRPVLDADGFERKRIIMIFMQSEEEFRKYLCIRFVLFWSQIMIVVL